MHNKVFNCYGSTHGGNISSKEKLVTWAKASHRLDLACRSPVGSCSPIRLKHNMLQEFWVFLPDIDISSISDSPALISSGDREQRAQILWSSCPFPPGMKTRQQVELSNICSCNLYFRSTSGQVAGKTQTNCFSGALCCIGTNPSGVTSMCWAVSCGGAAATIKAVFLSQPLICSFRVGRNHSNHADVSCPHSCITTLRVSDCESEANLESPLLQPWPSQIKPAVFFLSLCFCDHWSPHWF